MAGPFRATLFFIDGQFGWSETHWNPNSADDIGKTFTKAETLVKLRAPLMGIGPILKAFRVSNDAVQRDSYLEEVNLQGGDKGEKLAVEDPSDVPYSAILLRGESSSLYRKQIYLRGCPDSIIVDPAGPLKPAAWAAAFNKWKAELVANWGFVGVKKPPDITPAPLTAVSSANPCVVQCFPDPLLASGDRVRLQKMVPKFVRAGQFIVKALGGGSYQLQGVDTSAYAWQNVGELVPLVKHVTNYTDIIIIGETHRKTGRPFNSAPGRAKRRA